MTITYKNINVHFMDEGSGKTLVLLHGFLENALMWKPFSEALSQHFRVVAIDLLGHGETAALGYVHTMEDNADMVHFVLDSLDIQNAIIAGHSMGGYVALALAELYPELISGIMLINSTSRADSAEKKANRSRAISAVKKDYTSFVRLAVGNLFSENNRERLNSEIERVKQQALHTPLQGIIASLEGMKARKDREALLHSANFPVALILGKQDPIMNYNDNRSQADYPKVTLTTLPDGHMAPIENKEELLELFLAFMQKI